MTDLPPAPPEETREERRARIKQLLLERAGHAAAKLLTTQWVEEVWLFGSMARGTHETNSDADLILVVDEYRYKAVLYRLREELRDLDPYDHKNVRISATRDELNLGNLIRGTGINAGLDLIVVPQGWLDRLVELQGEGHHRDMRFMKNIARGARLYSPSSGTFLPPQR